MLQNMVEIQNYADNTAPSPFFSNRNTPYKS